MNLSQKNLKTLWILSICSLVAVFDFIYQRLTLIFSYPQSQFLPFVKAYANPALYPTDPMVKTRFGYLSFYPKYLGYLLKYFSHFELLVYLNHTFWVLLSLVLVFKITDYIFRSERAAMLSTALLFFQFPMFYGYQGHFRSLLNPSHNIVGFAFGTAAIYALLQKRSYTAFVLLAAGAYFHSLSIFHLIVLLFLNEVFCYLNHRVVIKDSIKKYTPAALFFVLVLPLLYFEMQNKRSYSSEDITTFLNVNLLDSFPLEWSPNVYFNFGIFLVLIFFCLNRLRNKMDPKIEIWSRNIIFASVLLSVMGLIGVEVFRSPFAIVFQASRCTLWIAWIGSAYIAAYIALRFRQTWFFYLGLISILTAITYQIGYVSLTNPLFALAIIFFQLDEKHRFWTWDRSEIYRALLALSFIFYWIFAVLNNYLVYPPFLDPMFLKIPNMWLPLTILTLWLLIFWLAPSLKATKRNTILAFASVCISVIFLTLIFFFRNDFYTPAENAWFEVQRQAKGLSQPDESFVTPPWLYGFRVLSERMPIGERIDGTQQYFSPEYGNQYRERMRALGFDTSRLFLAQMNRIYEYNHMSRAQLAELKVKYGAKFYIVQKKFMHEEPTPTKYDTADLLVVFENDFFRIVKIP